MAGYRPPLTEHQIDLLRWVSDGCPEGTYDGYGYRGSARNLEARGLLSIKGRGASWTATITEEGERHLEARTDDPGLVPQRPRPARSGAKVTTPASEPRPEQVRPAVAKPKATAYVRKTDVMMDELRGAPDGRLTINPDERDRYARLVSLAKRRGLVPEGMSLEITHKWARTSEGAAVWLQPLPEWQTRTLARVPVAIDSESLTDVVNKLDARADVEFDPNVRPRALRILDALVREVRARGYKVRAGRAPVLMTEARRDEYVDPDRLGHLRVQIGDDVTHLCLTQVLVSVPHVATKAELARSGRGWGPPPEFDQVPSDRLQVVLHGDGTVHWGSRWADTQDAPLEESLARVLQEAELRHQALEDRRAERARKEAETRKRWEEARSLAVKEFRADHRVHVLLDQIKQLRLVAEIREYAAAVRAVADGYEDVAQQGAAREWADWAATYADSIDPFREPIHEPADAKPSDKALAEYMHPWSPTGPYQTVRPFGFTEPTAPERGSWWQDRSIPPWRR
ncbi:hypothetical protein [Cellulomonas sp. ES6]|uniref:hypothetical protein n=1 Tax=Cellulomonas sp. ES6 TaxID=3039384 RepID=UPI0024B79C37|nr:hypothetical protein [Cellulomonas sp. ES6]WHP18857.1 hypothetical protein P9841_06995 [Cellulomonas sp. ES6]